MAELSISPDVIRDALKDFVAAYEPTSGTATEVGTVSSGERAGAHSTCASARMALPPRRGTTSYCSVCNSSDWKSSDCTSGIPGPLAMPEPEDRMPFGGWLSR